MNAVFKKVTEVPFEFKPGRFFHTMWYFPIPPAEDHLLGGNTTGLIWRLDDEPDSWRMTYRMRYYNSRAVDDRKDTKNWYCIHASQDTTTPETLLDAAKFMFEAGIKYVYGDVKPCEPDRFDFITIQGDSYKFMEVALREKKAWLDIKLEKK